MKHIEDFSSISKLHAVAAACALIEGKDIRLYKRTYNKSLRTAGGKVKPSELEDGTCVRVTRRKSVWFYPTSYDNHYAMVGDFEYLGSEYVTTIEIKKGVRSILDGKWAEEVMTVRKTDSFDPNHYTWCFWGHLKELLEGHYEVLPKGEIRITNEEVIMNRLLALTESLEEGNNGAV